MDETSTLERLAEQLSLHLARLDKEKFDRHVGYLTRSAAATSEVAALVASTAETEARGIVIISLLIL